MGSSKIDGTGIDLFSIEEIALKKKSVVLDERARKRCSDNRSIVEEMLEKGKPLYGINTGFGDLARVSISNDDLARLQTNLIRSHAVGVGSPLSREVVRAALLLRANTLARGASGVRPILIDSLLALLNANVSPLIPEKGSLGASGDLAPLAHMSLVLLGEGKAFVGDECLPGLEALEMAGIPPLELQAKEGLALINGTPIMSAIASLSLLRARKLIKAASIIAAMSIEALRGTDAAFDPRIHELRGHPGQIEIARFLRETLSMSSIRQSHLDCKKVQDAYSLRCTPQVLGACLDAWLHSKEVVERELNAVTDNPLVFEDGIFSGGNFHGEPIGLVCDYLSSAMSEIGSISERRCFRLLTSSLSDLPPFLVKESGVNSGLMIAQYTAASLASENKILSHPATTDSIPSSADQEDHVSMATTAARKTWAILDNLENILSVEYLCASQAIDLLHPLEPSPATKSAHTLLRDKVPTIDDDRCFGLDIEKSKELIVSGEVERLASEKISFEWELL